MTSAGSSEETPMTDDRILSAEEVLVAVKALRILPTVSEEGEAQAHRLIDTDRALRADLAAAQAHERTLTEALREARRVLSETENWSRHTDACGTARWGTTRDCGCGFTDLYAMQQRAYNLIDEALRGPWCEACEGMIAAHTCGLAAAPPEGDTR